ncbi:hypothetical protein SI65_05850 [Aspergillus cristatus]|uniref:Uncharacterized protein n=1 Tax=Aspergillus cristatus TaxID=573508 RepID=A0A1E3BE34_ASPCR|nr:hypothetical protein SI65_05850 [Aspergillus cristatus]
MSDIRPTAKWANRMLRPLTSIYRRLEKHQENLQTVANTKILKERTECPAPSTGIGSASTSRGSSKAPTTTATDADRDSGSDGEEDDPAWVPGKPEGRKIRHNYSSRGKCSASRGGRRRSRMSIRSPEVQRTLPGAIEIATPLLAGKHARGGLLGETSARRRLFRDVSPVMDELEVEDARKTTRPYHNFTASYGYSGSWREALDRSGDPGLVEIARLLDRLFLTFLHNTRIRATASLSSKQKSRGARSLLSMTVRRLPEFIAEEQMAQDEADEDGDEDMCDAYFTELEAHYAPSGNGWQPLREALRAQGIYLVSEMLQKEFVTKHIACRLLEECMNNQEHDAFESLLSKFLCTMDEMYDYPMGFDSVISSSSREDPVQLLATYCSRFPGRRSSVYEELAKLLVRRIVPAEWMVTAQWKKYVDAAIRSISTEADDSVAAAHLIEAVVLSASGVLPVTHETSVGCEDQLCPVPVKDALSNLTLSLITALCGMYLARSRSPTPGTGPEGVGPRVRAIVGSLAFTVQQEIEMRSSPEVEFSAFHSLRRGCILLGERLLQCDEVSYDTFQPNSQEPRNIDSFYVSLSSQSGVIKELAILARQVFRCCERVHGSDDQPGTSPEVRAKIGQLAEFSDEHGLSTFLGKVAAETAMQLAEATVYPDDHVWAAEIQERVVARQQELSYRTRVHESEDDDDGPGLYRWEESIQEWVTRTPKSKSKSVDFAQISPVETDLDSRASSPASFASVSASSQSDEDSASSVTSASSLPVKRTFPGRGEPSRAPKRLRSMTWRSRDDQMQQIPAIPPTPATSDDSDDDWEEYGYHPRRRGMLDTWTQERSLRRMSVPEGGQSVGFQRMLEVVITHKRQTRSPKMGGTGTNKPQEGSSYSADRQLRPRRPGRHSWASSLSKRTSTGSECGLSSAGTTGNTVIPRTPAMIPMVPWSPEDDSDDELSFL